MLPSAAPRAVAVNVDRRDDTVRYSICTLVTRMDEYREMVASFEAGGFAAPDCEYLYLDNTRSNAHEAYVGYNRFLQAARGEYVVLCHQDVALLDDGRARLDAVLADLTRRDPHWGLCGNAGGVRKGEHAVRITDPSGPDQWYGVLPAQVVSLDENFIVVRRSANLALSRELRGYHLYGAELCLVAEMLGHSAYVVDFHLLHKSVGAMDEHFHDLQRRMVQRCEAAFRPRWITTTCTEFFVSGSPVLNRLVYRRGGERLVNALVRLRNAFARRVVRARVAPGDRAALVPLPDAVVARAPRGGTPGGGPGDRPREPAAASRLG